MYKEVSAKRSVIENKSVDMYFPLYIHIYVNKVKLATLVEGDQKAPFSIATKPTCRGGCYSSPGIAPLYL